MQWAPWDAVQSGSLGMLRGKSLLGCCARGPLGRCAISPLRVLCSEGPLKCYVMQAFGHCLVTCLLHANMYAELFSCMIAIMISIHGTKQQCATLLGVKYQQIMLTGERVANSIAQAGQACSKT